MLGELLGELVIKPLFELALQLIGYFTARGLVPMLSLGRAMVEPAEPGVKVYPKWHGFNRAANGKIVIHCETGALLGIIFWLAVFMLWFVCYG